VKIYKIKNTPVKNYNDIWTTVFGVYRVLLNKSMMGANLTKYDISRDVKMITISGSQFT